MPSPKKSEPKKVATPVVSQKEKNEKLNEYKAKKAQAEQMLLISNPNTSIANAVERSPAPIRKPTP